MKYHSPAATKTQPVTTSYHKLPAVTFLFFSLSLYIFISLYLAAPASAAIQSQCDPAANMDFACLGEAVNATILGPTNITSENMARNTADLMESLAATLNTALGAGRTETLSSQLPYNPYIHGGGVLGSAGTLLGTLLVNQPNRLVDEEGFFKEALANNILNPNPAYAQSVGVNVFSRSGFLDLWRLMRNVAYIGLAAALAIFGLMVMFRAKADPRTTVTFQMALPRVAIAVVLIYFSLPLAGLLMDVGEVASAIITGFFGAGAPLPPPSSAGGDWPIKPDFGTLIGIFVNPIAKLPISGFGILDGFIVLIARLFALGIVLKILWTLISRYATIFIQVIFGPISFVLGVLPGRDDLTLRWFKTLLVNVLVFPGIYLVINLANVIRLIGNIPLPSVAGPKVTTDVSGLLALGVLSLAPAIPALLEEMFDVVPGAHVSRAGASPGGLLKGVPVVGHFIA